MTQHSAGDQKGAEDVHSSAGQAGARHARARVSMTFQLAGRLDASPCVPAKPFSGIDSAVEAAMLERHKVFFFSLLRKEKKPQRFHPKDG